MKTGFLKKGFTALLILLWGASAQAGFPAQAPGAAEHANAVPSESEAKRPKKEPKYKEGELIVKFRSKASETEKNKVHQKRGSKRLKEFPSLRLHHVKLKEGLTVEEAIREYQADPDVEYAEPNYIYTTQAAPNDPRFGELWGLRNTGQTGGTSNADINATTAWNTTTGSSNVVIAVIDTGVEYTHPDLAANMWKNPWEIPGNGIDDDGNGYVDDVYGIDAYNYDADPMDDAGHGTHVAGTIGAVGSNGEGVVGVNWNVRMMACKYLNSRGSGYTVDAIVCLQYVKGMKDKGVNIVATSNSWGGGSYSAALYDAIKAMPDVLFIAAAGNDAVDNDSYDHFPADYDLPNVISVAATDHNDQLAGFSDYGKRSVHVGAPGVDILSTVSAQNKYGAAGGYTLLSGTSMATPHVSGLAALLKAQDAGRDWKTIKNLILTGGDTVPALAEKTITGKRINAAGSMACADRPVFAARDLPRGGFIPGKAVPLSVVSINCGNPAGPVTVTTSGGEAVTLVDDGTGADQAAGDGVFTGLWTPTLEGERVEFSSTAGSLSLVLPQLRIYQHQPEANVRAPYRQSLSALGGIKPYHWSIVSGTLPSGLALEDSGGVISGTATATGTYSFTAQVTDSDGATAIAPLTLKVADDFLVESRARMFDSGDWDRTHRITFDAEGNYYLAGTSFVAMNRSYDAIVSKYDPAGTLLWARTYQNGGDEYWADVKVDAGGNVYLAGRVRNLLNGAIDCYLVKYDASGNLLWSRTYDSGADDYVAAIALDADGDVYASGARRSYNADTQTWADNIFTAKFDNLGNLVWERLKDNPQGLADPHAYGSGVAIDGSGNVYVGGGVTSSTTQVNPSNPATYCRTSNLLVVKYDRSGNELWSNAAGQVNYGSCSTSLVVGTTGNITVDGEGNAYLTGTPSPVTGDGCRTLKYDAAGNLLWQASYVPSEYPRCNGVAADSAGNSFVAVSKSYQNSFFFAVLKYGPDGGLLWEKSLAAGHSDGSVSSSGGAYGVALDAAGDIHATGQLYNGVNTDTLTVTLKDISGWLRIDQVQLPAGARGVSYRGELAAVGGEKPYSWALASGALPEGLTLDGASGVISGAPAAAGISEFTVRVTDAKGATATVTGSILVTYPVLQVTSSFPANGAVVPVNSAVQAAFNDQFDPASLTPDNFTLFPSTAAKAIAAKANCVLVLKLDGAVQSWGTYNCTVPAGVPPLAAIAAGTFHVMGIKSDGTLVAWGDNSYGQSTIPAGLTGITAVAGGLFHSVALRGDGTVTAWGQNTYGQATVPAGLTGVAAIAAGDYHTVALKKDGTVVAWGWNSNGQTTAPSGLAGVTAIEAGGEHTVALKSDGTVVAWGSNSSGQSSVPAGLAGVAAISAGFAHTVALKKDGTVVAWGDNEVGQVSVPAGLAGVRAIAARCSHNVALKKDGSVTAWGGISPAATPTEFTSSSKISGTLSRDPASRTATLTPSAPLTASVTYCATVSGFTNLAGIALTDPVSWCFRASNPLSIGTALLPQGALGSAYSQTLGAVGGLAPYTWSVPSGMLPKAVSCGATTGIISGTPVASGLFNFTAQVTDSQQLKAAKAFSIYVPAPGCLTAPVRISGHTTGTYSSFAGAYAEAADNDTIQLQNLQLGIDMILDRNVKMTLSGGYNCGFSANGSDTSLLGTLRLMNGTTKVEKLRLR